MKTALLTLAALMALPAFAQNSATVHLYSRSLVFNPTTAVNRTGGASYTLNFTTYDPQFNLPQFIPATGSNGVVVVSSEVKQRATPGIYETSYSFWQGSSMTQDGLLVLQLPATDRDHNRVRDIIEPSQVFYAGSTGKAYNVFPSTNTLKFEARLSREADQTAGVYSGLIYTTNANYVFNGTLNVLGMDGSTTYYRGSTNYMDLDLVRTGKGGALTHLTGTASYKATATYIMFNRSVLSDDQGRNYFLTNGTLTRIGNRYVGSVHFSDGDLDTPWPDFNHWVMELVDENDASGNGIPDISDPAEVPDDLGPTVSVVVPASSVRVDHQPITFRGTAKDRSGVDRVEFRVENENGSSDFFTADGTTRWSATIDSLVPGRNLVYVRAWDTAGNVSGEIRRLVIYTGQ